MGFDFGLPMMLLIFVAEGGLSVLVLGESGRGNEPTKDSCGFELLILSENLLVHTWYILNTYIHNIS